MLLKIDLDHILENAMEVWPSFKGGRIFITGGTGFVGKWLLESLLYANEHFDLGVKAVILTRDPARFNQEFPHLVNNKVVSLYQGDICTFQFPAENFTHVIHGATDVSNTQTSLTTYGVIATGTKRVLEFCHERGIRDILFISSGAVYGRQPPEMKHIDEEYCSMSTSRFPQTAYAQGKRTAEWFAHIYNSEFGLQCRIARCFAFIGPYLPLTGSFAVSHFVANLIRGESIKIKGDGTTIRSYLYAADMTVWLWSILVNGIPGTPYNVGSDEEISIQQLALKLARLESPALNIEITQTRSVGLAERYVPSINLVQKNLGLQVKVQIDDALSRMVNWTRGNIRTC